MAERKVPWLALLPPVIFAALAGLFLGGMYRDDPDALPSTIVGQAAPALDLAALPPKAGIAAEAMGDGQVKIVNYWASWCAPCRIEHPQLMQLASEGVPVYGVNFKDDPAKALAFLDQLGDPYTGIGADRTGRAAIEWGVYGVPETFVVDGDGKVLLRFAGPITEVILEKRIRPVIGAASGSQ